MSIPTDFWSDETQTATVKRGLAIYNADLKSVLEPAYLGQVVAIHVESGDYAVGRNSSLASRALRSKQPDGLTVSVDIGNVPVDDPLSQRLRGGSNIAGGKR